MEIKLNNMQRPDLQALIADRLEDMADRVEYLYSRGFTEEAELLREEGLMLAGAYDDGATFLFINDLTEV